MEVRGQNGGAMEKNPTSKQSSRSDSHRPLELHLVNLPEVPLLALRLEYTGPKNTFFGTQKDFSGTHPIRL